MGKATQLFFPTLEYAWEGIQELLINNQREITEKGLGGTYGTEMAIYNLLVNVERAKISSDFNFGANLGYSIKKWSKLVNNYINFDYLDLVKSEVMAREKKKSTSYNILVRFDNSHNSGKDCLIGLQFQKRLTDDYPTIIFTTRASEATKRMIFDYLLLQRMAEYVYGKEQIVQAMLFIPFCYINVESFLIYCGYKGGPEKVLLPDEKTGKYTLFQERVIARWAKFKHEPVDNIKYRVHKRAAMQIQGLSGQPDLFARDLKLNRNILRMSQKSLDKLNKGLM